MCKYRLPCGWCDKRNCQCQISLSDLIKWTTDYHPLEVSPNPQYENCPTNPFDDGTDISNCILETPPATYSTTTSEEVEIN